jgi:hypothetical protein
MRTIGDFQLVRRLDSTPKGTEVWIARRVDDPAAAPPRYAVKIFSPPDYVSGDQQSERLLFLEAAETQRELSERCPRFAPVHDSGLFEASAWYATDLYTTPDNRRPSSLATLRDTLGQRTLNDRELGCILLGVCEAILELRATGRGHGRITPSNVLLTSLARPDEGQIVVVDPLPSSRITEETDLRDEYGMAQLIYELIFKREATPAAIERLPRLDQWQGEGRSGAFWFQLCQELSDPGNPSRRGLEQVAELLRQAAGSSAGSARTVSTRTMPTARPGTERVERRTMPIGGGLPAEPAPGPSVAPPSGSEPSTTPVHGAAQPVAPAAASSPLAEREQAPAPTGGATGPAGAPPAHPAGTPWARQRQAPPPPPPPLHAQLQAPRRASKRPWLIGSVAAAVLIGGVVGVLVLVGGGGTATREPAAGGPAGVVGQDFERQGVLQQVYRLVNSQGSADVAAREDLSRDRDLGDVLRLVADRLPQLRAFSEALDRPGGGGSAAEAAELAALRADVVRRLESWPVLKAVGEAVSRLEKHAILDARHWSDAAALRGRWAMLLDSSTVHGRRSEAGDRLELTALIADTRRLHREVLESGTGERLSLKDLDELAGRMTAAIERVRRALGGEGELRSGVLAWPAASVGAQPMRSRGLVLEAEELDRFAAFLERLPEPLRPVLQRDERLATPLTGSMREQLARIRDDYSPPGVPDPRESPGAVSLGAMAARLDQLGAQLRSVRERFGAMDAEARQRCAALAPELDRAEQDLAAARARLDALAPGLRPWVRRLVDPIQQDLQELQRTIDATGGSGGGLGAIIASLDARVGGCDAAGRLSALQARAAAISVGVWGPRVRDELVAWLSDPALTEQSERARRAMDSAERWIVDLNARAADFAGVQQVSQPTDLDRALFDVPAFAQAARERGLRPVLSAIEEAVRARRPSPPDGQEVWADLRRALSGVEQEIAQFTGVGRDALALDRLLREGLLPEETSDDQPRPAELAERLRAHARVIPPGGAFDAARQRVEVELRAYDRLARIAARGLEPGELPASLGEARAAWRAIASVPGWPGDVETLARSAAFFERWRSFATTERDRSSQRQAQRDAWTRALNAVAAGLPSTEAQFERLLGLAGDFGIALDEQPAWVRYNQARLALARDLRRFSAERPADPASAVKGAVGRFENELGRLLQELPESERSGVSEGLAGVQRAIAGLSAERPADPANEGPRAPTAPQRDQWRYDDAESQRQSAALGIAGVRAYRRGTDPPLVFVPVRTGGSVVFIAREETSFRLARSVLAEAPRKADELRTRMPGREEMSADQLGIRVWRALGTPSGWTDIRLNTPQPGRRGEQQARGWLSLGADAEAREVFAQGLAPREGPSDLSPMQGVSPAAAQFIAEQIGCRLPTLVEWRAALDLEEQSLRSSGDGQTLLSETRWALRRQGWVTQTEHLAALARAGIAVDQVPWLGRGTYWVVPGTEANDRAVWPGPGDGLMPEPVNARAGEAGAPRGRVFLHILGNVAEFVDAGSDWKIVGESVLSPPRPDARDVPTLAVPATLTAERRREGESLGFADVGWRMAFTPGGAVAPDPVEVVARAVEPIRYLRPPGLGAGGGG